MAAQGRGPEVSSASGRMGRVTGRRAGRLGCGLRVGRVSGVPPKSRREERTLVPVVARTRALPDQEAGPEVAAAEGPWSTQKELRQSGENKHARKEKGRCSMRRF